MNDKFHTPIFITGIQRSGTSLIARIINYSGAFAGHISSMYENIYVKDLIDFYYDQLKVPTSGQYPLLDTNELLIPVVWQNKIREILEYEKYNNRTWMLKGFRLGQMWPVWNYSFPNAKWIIVRRRTGDIINSCIKTDYMNAFKDKNNQSLIGVTSESDGWKWWIHQHEKRFVEMIEAGLNCKVVWPDRMVNGDYSQIQEALEWLGLPWDHSIINIIDPLLWHSKLKGGK